MYAQVVFPLPFRNSFTYSVPDEYAKQVQVGVRVVVSFGKRILTGFVISVADKTDLKEKIKPIKDVLDIDPIFDKNSLKFYEWISEYYLSSLGEALRNSVPYGLEVESKRKVVADKEICAQLFLQEQKSDSPRARVLELLSKKEHANISFVQKAAGVKNIHSILRTLERAGAVTILNQVENAKVKVKKLNFVRLAKPAGDIYEVISEVERRSPKQVVLLLEMLGRKKKEYQVTELLKKTKSNHSSLNSLAEKGLVEIFEKEIDRIYVDTYEEEVQNFELTESQKSIVKRVSKSINEKQFESFLLYGVTGSGKTQVYIELTRLALKKNKTAIILVPEISLTPQITSRFFNNFGSKVTVLHSRMSLGERYDSWRGIVTGKYSVAIGARSALFAPFKNIGLLVVDEEHDASYKQNDLVPKYNARDAAIIKANISKCPVVLGSATPSVESMYNAELGKFNLLELKERVDNAKLPVIKLIDVLVERKTKNMDSVFSRQLLEAINERLKKKEGIILLQNRRGFATQIYCEDCGEIVTCSECSVSMVHHLNKNLVRCHYCGISKHVPRACTNCGSLSLKFFGTGTQRVEDELEYYFPEKKIERVDSDSISKKGRLGIILNQFRKGEIDILVGTQMVSKGLDFSHVTLVGVIAAETSLWLPDFRADERTFQLLTQVAGRAGRSKNPGDVLIQTQNRRHFVLQKVLENNYAEFYQKELALRKIGSYPPFAKVCLIEAKDNKEENAKGAVHDFYNFLKKGDKRLNITTPSPAVIEKIKGFYRYQILIKSPRTTDPSGKILRNTVLNSFIDFKQKSRFRNIHLSIDIDPQSII